MRIAIIGYGAFGKLWADIFAPDFEVLVTGGSTYEERARQHGHTPVSREEALLTAEVIFYAVPISSFESVIRADIEVIQKSGNTPLLIDLLSVKSHPAKVFASHLPESIPYLLLHPMFGPQSVAQNVGLDGLNLVFCGGTASTEMQDFWKRYFTEKHLHIHEMTPLEHDEHTARTQAVTHYIAQLLNTYGIEHSPIETASSGELIRVAHSLAPDGGRLFQDMMRYNPLVPEMLESLKQASDDIYIRYTK